ncbi:M3 family oligoendopeptidase [candidate division WWE3 bacterium]|uniref:M3 family oligoendopeptidase n=1 Tax=candidate division WWE3 bacterium TaxID=2053526 RepID=A0A7X9DJH6_UNCKA|nr:M3 family oligoendopeptidase [candidate division WWE3 bacterium]
MAQTLDNQNKWDLSLLNINEKTFDPLVYFQPLQTENTLFVNKWKDDQTYLSDPYKLKEALDELENIESRYDSGGDAGYYFELRSAQEQDSSVIKGFLNQIHEFAVKIENERQFFLINLSKISPDNQNIFLNSPILKKHKHFLETLFRDARFILSDKEEQLLNITSNSSYGNWVQMTSDLISREEREIPDETGKVSNQPVTQIIKLTNSPNKKVRDQAAKAYNDILKKYVDVAEAEMNSIIQHKRSIDKVRGFTRPDESRIISDDMELATVDTLLDSVVSRYDISKDFYKFKAKLFGFSKLAYHERNLDYGRINKEKYTYEYSVNLVKTVFKNLDAEFMDIYECYLNNGRFDVFPRKGKVFGAFCSSGHLEQPGYILLNHTDLLTDVTTIAHEMGHAINNELIRKSQSAFYFDTPLSTAEVASTFMEDFVLEELEKTASDELKLAILIKRLDEDVSTIMRQVACYKFEQDLHNAFAQQGYVVKDEISKLFQKNMADYMGEGVSMDAGSENWWVYWSHIRSFFYVYSYASGLLISRSLQHKYKEDHSFMNHIKEFLSAGTSDSPYNIFMKMGIDIKDGKFWFDGLNQVSENLSKAKNLATKLGKI